MAKIIRDKNDSGSRKGLYWLIPVLLVFALFYSMKTRSQSSKGNSEMPDTFSSPATNGAIVSGTGNVNLLNGPSGASGTGVSATSVSGTGVSGTGIVSGTSR